MGGLAGDGQQLNAGIGVLGGMFDPVHYGHLRMAVEVREALELAEVRLVPAANPVHREATRASCEERLAMLRLALAGRQELRADARECERGGASYMVDTLASLRDELPRTPLVLLLGADAFNGLAGWHRWRDILELAHLAVMTRPGWELQAAGELADEYGRRRCEQAGALRERLAGYMFHCRLTPLMISSSDIRERVARGRALDFLLPEAVAAHIRGHHLYH